MTFKPRAVKADKNQPWEETDSGYEYIPRTVQIGKWNRQDRSIETLHRVKAYWWRVRCSTKVHCRSVGRESNFGKLLAIYSVIDALTTAPTLEGAESVVP